MNRPALSRPPVSSPLASSLALALLAAAAGAATVPEAAEPNDPIAGGGTATVITNDDIGTGSLTPIGDADSWDFGPAVIGDVMFCYFDGRGGVTSGDTTLLILGPPALTNSLSFDSDSGPSTSSARAFALTGSDGNLGCRVSHQTNSATIVPYSLYGANVPAADAAAETEANDTAGTADPITAGMTTGVLAAADVDFFSFPADAGADVVVIFDEDPDDDGQHVDSRLTVFSTDGTTALSTLSDVDDDAANRTNALGPVTTSNTGTHFLRVTNGGGAVDGEPYRFVVKVDGGQIVPVTLTGFSVD